MWSCILFALIIILLFCPGIRFLIFGAILFYLFKYGDIKWITDGLKLFFSWWRAFYRRSSYGKFLTLVTIILLIWITVNIVTAVVAIIIFN